MSLIPLTMVVDFGVLLLLLLFSSLGRASVWYDERAVVINGERRMLFSGSIHYPRSTPKMWPELIAKAKEGGLDVIQTYVFWNGHEPSPGRYYFEDQYDLVRFIRTVKEAGLYVHLRIGPYICAEWNFGGFPVWLKRIPGISFRENNGPFKKHMHRFVKFIVNKMKEESLFEPQGGPIILCQIENELGPVEYDVGSSAREYAKWAARMALGLWTNVPWVMCKEEDAPYPIIDTCNGFYCEGFRPNNRSKPMMWTEAWTGWYTGFGKPIVERSAQDLAYSVALSIMNGMAFVNYYMYHGGTNFGRTAGGPFIATSYDYDAPLDEFGLKKQPKWGHLKQLHRAIKFCEPVLIAGSSTQIHLGDLQEAWVFTTPSGACAAFLANHDAGKYAKVAFRNKFHDLPPWSVSILPDCENTAFNTAMVGTQTTVMKMTPVVEGLSWMSYGEATASCEGSEFTTSWMLEQINITRDQSDYLWYMTEVNIGPEESFLKSGKWPVLTVESSGHSAHVFINGVLSGTGYGSVDDPKFTFVKEVELIAGINKISLLSMAVGLPNVGRHFEQWQVGVLGHVYLTGVDGGTRELTWQSWCYKIGLHGENLELNSLTGSSSVDWNEHEFGPLPYRPLMWYKATFDVPAGVEPLAVDMGAMSKGRLWVNGRDLGRHWPAYTAQGQCAPCNYTGWFSEKSCLKYCNLPSQRWYHLPREWVNPRGNLLVVFEELGGDPRWISVVKKEISSVCAEVDEMQPSIEGVRPRAHISCGPGEKIESIKFASFGTPGGSCGAFVEGSCHSHSSYDIFQRVCVGARSCSVRVSPENFGDPCPWQRKKLSVEAVCGV